MTNIKTPKEDVVIIGSGPCGMSAAIELASFGIKVVVLDEQPKAGGQIYRNLTDNKIKDRKILGEDYYNEELLRKFSSLKIKIVKTATVWHVESQESIKEIFYSTKKSDQRSEAQVIKAKYLIIATGAMERPMPVLGWHLPGVMTAGAAQIMLKNSAVAYEDGVFIGTGPLLYLIVAQYIRAGIAVKALLDITPKANYLKALFFMVGALRNFSLIKKGRDLLREIKESNIPIYREVKNIRLLGKDQLEEVNFDSKGQSHKITSKKVFLHQGIVPNLNLVMAMNGKISWCKDGLCMRSINSEWGENLSLKDTYVVGDGASINGALAAIQEGHIAALSIACKIGRIDPAQRDKRASFFFKNMKKEKAIRPFLTTLYRPPFETRIPREDDVLVCRCEEVTYGEIRQAIDLKCAGTNQIKSFTRSGMGLCQGRQCGLTVLEIFAKITCQDEKSVDYYRIRPPIKPVTLNELSQLTEDS